MGGLSGAFIPVSEDEGMIAAAQQGALGLDKLEAMTCVCSVGLDMIAVPGDTSAETISAIIADEAAIGMVNTKTTAVHHPRPRQNRGGHGGVWRPAGVCPGDPGAPLLLCRVHPAGRADPCPHAEFEKLRGRRPMGGHRSAQRCGHSAVSNPIYMP